MNRRSIPRSVTASWETVEAQRHGTEERQAASHTSAYRKGCGRIARRTGVEPRMIIRPQITLSSVVWGHLFLEVKNQKNFDSD